MEPVSAGQPTQARRIRQDFPLEADLVERFAPFVPSVFGTRGVVYRREVELGARIADIVAWANPARPTSDTLAPLKRASVGDLAVLAHLLERPLSVRTLAERTYTGADAVDFRMRTLNRWGLVSRQRSAYELGVWADKLPSEVVAVEAKLEDWRTAVKQAAYYLRFADAAWVLLPADTNAATDARDACRRTGVGLLLFDGETVAKSVRARRTQGSQYLRRLMKLRLAWNLARVADA
jgi:predicted transcriptional regulator